MGFGTVKVDSITSSTQTLTVDNLLESADIGSTVQGYDADTAKTDTAQTFTAAQRGTITTLTDGATITPDFSASNNFTCRWLERVERLQTLQTSQQGKAGLSLSIKTVQAAEQSQRMAVILSLPVGLLQRSRPGQMI